jgi:hypothetical protein
MYLSHETVLCAGGRVVGKQGLIIMNIQRESKVKLMHALAGAGRQLAVDRCRHHGPTSLYPHRLQGRRRYRRQWSVGLLLFILGIIVVVAWFVYV